MKLIYIQLYQYLYKDKNILFIIISIIFINSFNYFICFIISRSLCYYFIRNFIISKFVNLFFK